MPRDHLHKFRQTTTSMEHRETEWKLVFFWERSVYQAVHIQVFWLHSTHLWSILLLYGWQNWCPLSKDIQPAEPESKPRFVFYQVLCSFWASSSSDLGLNQDPHFNQNATSEIRLGLSKKYLEKAECREGEVKKREVSKFKFRSLVQGSTNFCHKRPNLVNILGFAGYMISVTTPELSH